MIVIPPRDPNESADPAAEALGKLYEQFTNVQNLGEFHAALRKRDALYDLQHQEMTEKPGDYENLHPKDFFNQFHRRADEDDKTVVSEAPYRIRQQLRDVLAPERDTALGRAKETYKKLFIDRQLAQLDEDRLYYLGKIADAANDQDRERYATALIGRLKLSGDVGLLYKENADRLIENIPSDLDIFSFNREFANDPARAQRLLLYGAYPNIRPELRDELVKEANEAIPDFQPMPEREEAAQAEVQLVETEGHSRPNNGAPAASNEAIQDDSDSTDINPDYRPGDLAAAAQTKNPTKTNTAGGVNPPPPVLPIQKFTYPIIDKKGRTISADDLNRATAVVYGEMTGSDNINQGKKFTRRDATAGADVETPMTKLGQVGEAHGLASILWNRLEKPGDYHSPGHPRPTNLREIIESPGQFRSVGERRCNEAMNGLVSDPQAYGLAREAVENAARNGPMFNFDSNLAVEQNRRRTRQDQPRTVNRTLNLGDVNMGSGTDFWRRRQ